LKTIRRIVTERNKRGLKRPQIRTNTIFPAIAEDPARYWKEMRDAGVDWITVNEIYDTRGNKKPDHALKKKWACPYPFQRLVISSNGSVLPCTGAYNEPGSHVLGRYRGTSLKKIKSSAWHQTMRYPETNIRTAWRSKKLNELRTYHRENRRQCIDACRNCVNGMVTHGVQWIPHDWDMKQMRWKDSVGEQSAHD
jgi:hypothetical protein